MPMISYHQAVNMVMYFGGVLTVMFGTLILIVALVVEMTGQDKLTRCWLIFSNCSLITGIVFIIGIALILRAEGRKAVLE